MEVEKGQGNPRDGFELIVDERIDKKILEAKFKITESRLRYYFGIGIAILTLFGIILPLVLTFQSQGRVDRAIDKMEENFKELAGKQTRKPEVVCFIEGENLENETVVFSSENEYKDLIIKNIGNGTADFIQLKLYGDFPFDIFPTWDWGPAILNDERRFEKAYRCLKVRHISKHLAAKDWMSTYFVIQPDEFKKTGKLETSALLKVFYGESEPKEIPFTIRVGAE